MDKKTSSGKKIRDTEYSKRFTTSIRNCMFVHLTITLTLDAVLTLMGYECDQINTVLTTMMPVYIALQGANYVKSGYENGKKIVGSLSTSVSDSNTENG